MKLFSVVLFYVHMYLFQYSTVLNKVGGPNMTLLNFVDFFHLEKLFIRASRLGHQVGRLFAQMKKK